MFGCGFLFAASTTATTAPAFTFLSLLLLPAAFVAISVLASLPSRFLRFRWQILAG
jgi:hypothetical protein